MNPDVLLCLGASRLLFFGLTTGFNPTVFLPMGGETSKAVGNIYWDDRWIKRLRYRFLYSPIFKKNLKHVDEVWGWSEGNRELFSQFGLPSGQFVPFDWGNIDYTRFSPNGDAATFAHEGDTVIGSFRRIRGNKLLRHYEAFMNAIGKLREERDDFSVVIGGFYADGSSSAVERLVDEKIQEYNLDDTVEKYSLFEKSEMPSKYRGVDVYVNMNHDDLQLGAIGTSVKEAMACGCASVHFDSPDLTYVIEDGRNGVVVSPTTKSVYNSVSMLINDSKQRTSIADRGRQTAKENFSDEAIRDRVIRRLRRLI
jgi:glycosyltransferase involved in cell wall biosynthesis